MSKNAKINEKFKGDYLAMNIRETDIYEEGIAQGAEQKAIEIAKQGLLLNISYEQLSQLTGLSLEIVEQLGKEQTNQNQ
jgi:predicted transposase YdaD